MYHEQAYGDWYGIDLYVVEGLLSPGVLILWLQTMTTSSRGLKLEGRRAGYYEHIQFAAMNAKSYTSRFLAHSSF